MLTNTWVGNYYVGDDGQWIPGYTAPEWKQQTADGGISIPMEAIPETVGNRSMDSGICLMEADICLPVGRT